jgi:hypothetical protein
MGLPQLLMIERAPLRGSSEDIPLNLERCRCERDVEERALAIAQVGKFALLPRLVRAEGELCPSHKILKAAFDQAKQRCGIGIRLMNLLPAMRAIADAGEHQWRSAWKERTRLRG